MKKVLHVLHSLERSGMEMMLLRSFEAWQRNGFAPEVLATAASVGPLSQELAAAGYRVHHLPLRGGSRYLPNTRFMRRFYGLCAQGYEVVHIHTEAAAPLYAVLARAAGVGTIALTKHNVFAFTGALRLRKVLERAAVRALGGRYGMISQAVEQSETTRFHNKGPRVINWIDTDSFRPPSEREREEARRSLGLTDGAFVLLSVGNCSRVKNHDAILHALAQLKEAPVCYLHLGREQDGAPERRLAAELGVAEKVRFVGSVTETRQYYWAADAYLMPSLHEGFSIAALEAVASGAPAVFGDVAGLADLSTDTRAALFVSPDAEGVEVAVRRLMATDAEVRRSHAAQDSEAIRKKYSIDNGVRCTIDRLYRDDAVTRAGGVQ